MSEHHEHSDAAGAEPVPPMAFWKKALVVLSLVAGCAGLALGGASSPDSGAASVPGNQGASVGASSFGPGVSVGGDGPSSGNQSGGQSTLWAPLLAKGGLSFFIAFCIGYALRTFLKGTMLVIGVVALAVFGLQKAGLLGEVDWERAQGYWDGLTANVGEQFDSFKSFVTGSLPSAASGGVGLLAGFRR